MRLRMVAFAGVLAAGLLLTPAAVGMLLEQQAGRALAGLQARHPGLRIQQAEFRRGWWHSESRQRLVLDTGRRLAAAGVPMGSAAPWLELEVVSQHRHGPLAGRGLRPALARAESRFTLGELGGTTRLTGTAHSRLALGGDAESTLTLDPLAVDFTDSYGGLDLFGGSFTLALGGDERTVVLEGTLPGAEWRSTEGSVTVADGRLRMRLERSGRTGPWNAGLRLEAETLRAWSRRAPRGQTSARALSLEARAADDEGRLAFTLSGAAGTLSLLGRQSRQLVGTVGIEGLSLESLRAVAGGRAPLPALLAGGGRIALDPLRAELHYGLLEGSVLVQLPEPAAGPAHPDAPWVLLEQATAHMHWRLPAGLVDLAARQRELTETVTALRKLQVLTPHGQDSYEVEAGFRDGVLTVNGVVLTLP